MKIFEGKSPSERNKIIAAAVLGALALLAIGYNVIGFFPSSKKTVTVSVSPTPTPASTTNRTGDTVVTALPKQEEIDLISQTTPVYVTYAPSASAPGRNIFAFFEPPLPTPYSPTPPRTPTPPPPTPTPPQPDLLISYISKQSVYEGEKGFRLEIGGDKFTPQTFIYFNGNQMPTNFISPQQLSTDIPANFIANEGQRQIIVQTVDGKSFSNPVVFNVQAPPRPQFQYLGIVSRKRGNNDMAYIQEQGQPAPVSKRLNDILGGRFRLVSIAPNKLMVQDVNLGFTHQVELVKASGQTSYSPRTNRNYPQNDGNIYQQYPNPNVPNPNVPNQTIPGIPNNIPRYIPPTPQQQQKKDDDEDDEDGDN